MGGVDLGVVSGKLAQIPKSPIQPPVELTNIVEESTKAFSDSGDSASEAGDSISEAVPG